MIDTILKYFEKMYIDRHAFMVKKGYIKKDVEYSDDLWNAFREEWLSKVDI